ncbi:MAG: Ig-like domain-containing protein [Bacteroidales bacterium]|nr:Ig-like domain-containing protein [Bacteroidales bacterium]
MKRAFFFAGLAAATLSFVGCNKEADVKGLDGVPVGIILSNMDTRTVNDGLSTKWVNGDALNVFYAVSGTQEYSANAKFEVDDAEANHATGTAELTADAYDWYLLYPYDSHVKTPANTNAGYLTVGSASNKTQTQTGLNSTAHLAGKNLPVYGVAKNVAVDETPAVTMKHVSAVVAVNLTNGTDKPLTVSSVSFTAPEDIVGTYYIDFSGDALGFTGSGTNYVSKTATLDVTGEEAVAAGASAKFYLAVKPFAAKAGDKFAVKVLAGDVVFEKEITLPSAVEFKSGMIKQLNVNYDGGSEITPSSLTEIAAMDNGTTVETNEVLVVAKYARGVMLAQDGFYLLAYDGDGVDAKIGDIVTVSGEVGEYAGFKQIASPVVKVVSSDNEVVLPEPKVLEGLDEYASEKVELIQYSGTLAVSGNFFNVKVDGSTRQGSIQYPLDADALKALDKKLVTATGFFTGITGSSTKYVNLMSTSVEEKAGNVFDATPTQINVPATATSAEINVTGNVDWTAVASEGATLDKTSGTGEAVIKVSFPANEDQQNTKEYTVFVRTEATGVNDEIEINITQAKADAAGLKTVAVDFSEQGYENGQALETVTIDGITFTFDKGANANNGPKYYTTGTAVRLYGGNTMTVSAGGKTIVSIELAFSSGEGTNAITTDVPTYAEPLWTGEAGSVTFTVGGTSGHRRIKGVTVKFKDDGTTPPVATLESIAVSGQKTEFTVGDTFVFDGKVTATYSDGSTKTVSPTSVSEPDMTTAGTKEVTVSYTESSVTKTAKYDITVNDAVVDGNTVSMTMTEYVAAHNCTISSGSDATMYKTLQLNESVRMYTTGDDNCGSFWGTTTQDWRLYQNRNGNVTIQVAEGCELKSVSLTFSVSNTGVLLDANGATVTSGSKNTVSGTSVTYTVGNSGSATNGQVRITAVEVVYTGDGTTFPDQPAQEITTTITMAGNQAIYVGETFALNATSNAKDAPITYESEDPTIASVDASGNVTGVAVGTVKVYAHIAAVAGQYTAAERYCVVTVSEKPEVVGGTWEVKDLSAIADGTQLILVSTNADGGSFALGNDHGTSTAPAAVAVTVASDGTISNPESNVIFVLKKAEGGYIFNMEGGESWVYCTNSNNGIRVGTGEHNVFSVDAESGYLVINDGTQNRYLGVYNKADWRAYTSVNNNIKDQTFTFFVKK